LIRSHRAAGIEPAEFRLQTCGKMPIAQNTSCCILSTAAKYPQPIASNLGQMKFFAPRKPTKLKIKTVTACKNRSNNQL
jgi:hypothetical protein